MLTLTKQTLDVGLVPHDVEAMTRFYGEVLGLAAQPPRVLPRSGTLLTYAVGSSVVKLLCTDPSPPRHPGGIDAAIGYRLIRLAVPDVDDVVARAQGAGMTGIRQRRDDRGGATRAIVLLADPDGNAVEIVGAGDRPSTLAVGLTVTDAARTRGFFCDVLGLNEVPPMVGSGVDVRSVRFGRTRVMYWQRADGLPVHGGRSTDHAGIRYLSAYVDSVAEAAASARERGVSIAVPTTATATATFCIIADPDGNWIELIEPNPAVG